MQQQEQELEEKEPELEGRSGDEACNLDSEVAVADVQVGLHNTNPGNGGFFYLYKKCQILSNYLLRNCLFFTVSVILPTKINFLN
jgi:hypothetical protein